MTRPDFSILIASHQKVEYLWACLRGLELLRTPHSFEVIVVNDGSTDATERFLNSYEAPFDLRCFHNENQGLATTRNCGLQASHGELVVMLDNDCVLTDAAMDALWSAHTRNPGQMYISTIAHVPIDKVAGVMGSLADQTLQFPLSEDLLTPEEGESTLQRILRLTKTRLHELHAGWFGAQGPSVCAARETLEALGGYDGAIRTYGMEDFDLGLRFELAGGKLIWVPESVIYHLDHGHNATELFSGTAASTGYFYRKHRHLPQAKPFLFFLSGEISFLECNNRIAVLLSKPPCTDPALDVVFCVYRMIERRKLDHRESVFSPVVKSIAAERANGVTSLLPAQHSTGDNVTGVRG